MSRGKLTEEELIEKVEELVQKQHRVITNINTYHHLYRRVMKQNPNLKITKEEPIKNGIKALFTKSEEERAKNNVIRFVKNWNRGKQIEELTLTEDLTRLSHSHNLQYNLDNYIELVYFLKKNPVYKINEDAVSYAGRFTNLQIKFCKEERPCSSFSGQDYTIGDISNIYNQIRIMNIQPIMECYNTTTFTWEVEKLTNALNQCLPGVDASIRNEYCDYMMKGIQKQYQDRRAWLSFIQSLPVLDHVIRKTQPTVEPIALKVENMDTDTIEILQEVTTPALKQAYEEITDEPKKDPHFAILEQGEQEPKLVEMVPDQADPNQITLQEIPSRLVKKTDETIEVDPTTVPLTENLKIPTTLKVTIGVGDVSICRTPDENYVVVTHETSIFKKSTVVEEGTPVKVKQ